MARKLLEVISHPLHELSTSSRGAVVSSLCFSWVTLFTPPFSDLGLLSRTVCSPRIQNKGFRIPEWRRKQRKPSSPQKPVSGKELPLTFHQPSTAPDSRFSEISVPSVCAKPTKTSIKWLLSFSIGQAISRRGSDSPDLGANNRVIRRETPWSRVVYLSLWQCMHGHPPVQRGFR